LSSLTTNLHHFQELMEKGLPIVFLDRVPKEIETHKVVADNFAGSYEATKHLILSGRKRIAHLNQPHLPVDHHGTVGWLQTGAGRLWYSFEESYVKYCHHGGKVVRKMRRRCMKCWPCPSLPMRYLPPATGLRRVVCRFCKKSNIKIPDEIAIVGFTNISVAELFNPPLTAVVQPAMEMGQQAVELLIRLIEHPQKTGDYEIRSLKTSLIIRESSGGKSIGP
jgi:LacI family transcriptional regulator